MKNKQNARVIAWLLTLLLVFSCLPAGVFAQEGNGPLPEEAIGQAVSQSYQVTFQSSPTTAEIVVESEETGEQTPIKGVYYLPDGDYHYTASNDGYDTLTGDFTVAGENLQLTVELQETTPFQVVKAAEQDSGAEATVPESITIDCDSTQFIGEGKLIGKKGDSFQFKAYDQNGDETPVTWGTSSSWLGTLSEDGLFTVTSDLTSGGSSSANITATSILDTSVKKNGSYSLYGYQFSSSGKNVKVALSSDGQTAKTMSATGGYNGQTIWRYDNAAAEGIATLAADPGNGSVIKFNALRPGTFTAGFKLAFDESMADTATFTITGLAVEDAAGTQGQTYLTRTTAMQNPTVQLTAYCEPGQTVASWQSANEAVAIVDENGLVTAKGIGSVIISAIDQAGTRGGIKVTVTDGETPYFESLEFSTTAFHSGIWVKDQTFSPTKTEYTLPIKNYSTSNLMLQATTKYDTGRYTAIAEYTDVNGEKQTVAVKSGAATTLANQPFDESTLTITLADKTDSQNKTVYSFAVSRPRDETKAIKSNGIVLVPEGRDLLATTYHGNGEGTMLYADENGTETSGKGVKGTQYYYRAYAQNGLEKFSLNLSGNTAYMHLRYSDDGGNSWKELPQGGGQTEKIGFTAKGAGNSVAEVQIQILDDKSYSDNVKAGKDGFAGAEPVTYKVWLEQLPPAGAVADMLEAVTDHGHWYPAFQPSVDSYNIMVANTSEAPVLTYKVSHGATVKIGNEQQQGDAQGNYTLALTTSKKSIAITSADGNYTNTYKIGYQKKSKYAGPDQVIDYLCINSQYTNGSYGLAPETTLAGTMKSLGNFGGYITYYYENALTDAPNHKYGVDFYVYGNAIVDGSSSTGCSFFEPGQVYVSEDGETWYALAGSEHYEKGTIWDYSVTYTKTANNQTAWSDNQGNSNDGSSKSGVYPLSANYPLYQQADNDSITLSGVMLPAADGTITGNGNCDANHVNWGYSDCFANGTIGEDVNPYLDNSDHKLKTNGFDLAWAVDEAGNPIDVSNKQFHYVKVATASNVWHDSFKEKSTEVQQVVTTKATPEAIGKTTAPDGVTISDGITSKKIEFTQGQQIYTKDLGGMKYVTVTVDGTDAADNIYINNQRVTSGEAATGIKVTQEAGEKLVRVIVQNGEKEPVIYLLKLTSSAMESNEVVEGIHVNVGGTVRQATTKDGENYTLQVGHRINQVNITPVVDADVQCMIQGKAVQDSYELAYGNNQFEIVATGQNGNTQTATLTITRDKAPDSSGKNITVHFALYGDESHGDNGTVHTYKSNKAQMPVWIANQSYTVPAEFTVLDVFERALKEKHLEWVNANGNYISAINGLAEFDNGELSGWMYTINGKHTSFGLAEQSLNNGDNIVFHYTDDYTKEQGSENWSGGGSSSSGTSVNDTKPLDKTMSSDSLTVKASELKDATSLNISGAIGLRLDQEALKAIGTNADLNVQAKKVTNPKLDTDAQNLIGSRPVYGITLTSGSKAVTKLSTGKITIGIPYTPVSGEDPTKLFVLYIDENSKAERINGSKYDSKQKAVVATVNHLSLYAVGYDETVATENSGFNDVPAGHWAAEYIYALAAKGYLKGKTDTAFGPNDNITRAEFAAILCRMSSGVLPVADSRFKDVKADAWYAQNVTWAVNAGVTKGVTESSFAPDAKISRQEMAVMLKRYAEYKQIALPVDTPSVNFVDQEQIESWAQEAVSAMQQANIINGKGENVFAPQDYATRAEAAKMLYIILQMQEK